MIYAPLMFSVHIYLCCCWNQTLYTYMYVHMSYIFGILHAGIMMGFESLTYVRDEGDEDAVRVRVNGESIRDFFVNYTQGA